MHIILKQHLYRKIAEKERFLHKQSARQQFVAALLMWTQIRDVLSRRDVSAKRDHTNRPLVQVDTCYSR